MLRYSLNVVIPNIWFRCRALRENRLARERSMIFRRQYYLWSKIVCGGQAPLTPTTRNSTVQVLLVYEMFISGNSWDTRYKRCCFVWQISCATSCQIPYRINVVHSSDRPHAQRHSSGKWRTIFRHQPQQWQQRVINHRGLFRLQWALLSLSFPW